MPTPCYVGSGDVDGEVLGRSGGKLGFYGLATPIAKRTGSSMTALTLTTAITATTPCFGFSTATAFSAFISQLEEMRATLVALGLHQGS